MIYGVALIAILLLVAAFLFLSARPGIKKIRGGIQMLHRRGRHHAEIKFIRPGTNKQLRFRKEVVGGIPTITLSLKELMLSAEELQRLMNFTAKNGIKIKSNKSRKFLLLGSSVDGANDIATNILADVLCMSRYARFRVEVQGIDYS